MYNWNISSAVKIREEELSSLCKESSLLRKLILTEKVSHEDFFYNCYSVGNPPNPKTVKELREHSRDIRVQLCE